MVRSDVTSVSALSSVVVVAARRLAAGAAEQLTEGNADVERPKVEREVLGERIGGDLSHVLSERMEKPAAAGPRRRRRRRRSGVRHAIKRAVFSGGNRLVGQHSRRIVRLHARAIFRGTPIPNAPECKTGPRGEGGGGKGIWIGRRVRRCGGRCTARAIFRTARAARPSPATRSLAGPPRARPGAFDRIRPRRFGWGGEPAAAADTPPPRDGRRSRTTHGERGPERSKGDWSVSPLSASSNPACSACEAHRGERRRRSTPESLYCSARSRFQRRPRRWAAESSVNRWLYRTGCIGI